jgi:hypothetical protein
MIHVVATLAHAFEPWKSLYSNSKPVATAVTSLHLLGLLIGGGLAVAADRSTLRTGADPADRGRLLRELHATHRPILIALAVVFLTGVALATADFDTFASSPAFGVKLLLVALLLANGAVLTRTEAALRSASAEHSADRDARLWRRLRLTSWLSLSLWAATVVAGTVLVNAA